MNISYANRGAGLEVAVEQANAQYLALGVATVQKVATPTKVVTDRKTGSLKPVREKSTVDFIGAWQGRPVAFDAKENHDPKRFQLNHVQEHQVAFLAHWHGNRGIAFLLVYQATDSAAYLVPYVWLQLRWDDWQAGGKASIPTEELRQLPRVRAGRGCIMDYLAALEAYLRPLGVLDRG